MDYSRFTFEQFTAAHETILRASGLPESLWEQVYSQLTTQQFTAGEYVEFSHFDSSGVVGVSEDREPGLALVASRNISANSAVFIVDHAFSFYTKEEAMEALEQVPSLRNRLQNLIDEECEEEDPSTLLELAAPLLHVYFVAPPDPTASPTPVFYLLDEVGSRITTVHTQDAANCKLGLFVCAWDGLGYTLAWPTKDIEEGAAILREDPGDTEKIRELLALPEKDVAQVVRTRKESKEREAEGVQRGAKEMQVGLVAINVRPGQGSVLVRPEDDIARYFEEMCGVGLAFDYIRLDDFPVGVSDNPELTVETAKTIAKRNRHLLVMAVGDMVEAEGFQERLMRCRDILAVLKAISVHCADYCSMYPTYRVLEFAYFKTTYMMHLQGSGVPILPTVFATAAEFKELGPSALAQKKALEVQAQRAAHFGKDARTRLDDQVLYVKSDSQWCREGNIILNLRENFDGRIEKELEDTLGRVLGEYRSSGVQIQPQVLALAGRNPEYRGYFLDGGLCVVVKSFFRTGAYEPGQETLVHSEIMLVDVGIPKDDDVFSGVPFAEIRKVMDGAHRALVAHANGPLIFLRVDCAVDGDSGEVMVVEVEAGLDSGTFPFLIKSIDIQQVIAKKVAKRFLESIQSTTSLPQ